ncbi:MAG: porin [Rickettsiales bacterium]|nr:porin [Rickettsiales bacterium]
MRKVFLYTTVLAGLCGVAIKAEARGLDVIVGGEINFQAGYADQKSAFKTGQYTRETKFANDTEVHVNVEGQVDNGVRYGAVIEMEADVNADARNEGLNADKTYIWLESAGGRIELGNNEGAEAAMAVNAATIARGTGGIDGDDEFYINLGGTPFLIHPDLPAADIGGIAEDATKVTYYTPDMNGVQMGMSYTPDQGDGGTASGFTGEIPGTDQENVFGLGLNYQGQYEEVGVEASLVGEFGDAEAAGTEDVSAWGGGLVLSSRGFSLAGSYHDWGDSGLAVGTVNDDQNVWTVGGAYETGPFGVSVTYLDSESQDHDFTNLSFGADYQLAPGLVPYVEVTLFDADENGTTVDNDGSVVLVGAELSF